MGNKNKKNNTYKPEIIKRTYSGEVNLVEYLRKLLVRELEKE